MIPEIGVMVSAYIIARMIDLAFTPRAHDSERVLFMIVSAFVIILALWVGLDLMARGNQPLPPIPGLLR